MIFRASWLNSKFSLSVSAFFIPYFFILSLLCRRSVNEIYVSSSCAIFSNKHVLMRNENVTNFFLLLLTQMHGSNLCRSTAILPCHPVSCAIFTLLIIVEWWFVSDLISCKLNLNTPKRRLKRIPMQISHLNLPKKTFSFKINKRD